MVYVVFGASALLSVLVVVLCLYLLRLQSNQHQREMEMWQKERAALLDRCMTKEWQTFQALQMSRNSPLDSTEVARGMSDEEELRRWAEAHANGVGVGEVLVDLEQDMKDLGLVPEK